MNLEKQVAELTKRVEELESDNQATGDLIREYIFDKKEKDPNVVYLEKGDQYWYIGEVGYVYSTRWAADYNQMYALSIGNVYASKEDAQAVVDLKKDIYRFDRPELEDMIVYLDVSNEWMTGSFEDNIRCSNEYQSGILMSVHTTEKSLQTRIKLLERARQNKIIKLSNE